MAIATALAITSLAIGAVSTVEQIQASKESNRAQRRAASVAQAQNTVSMQDNVREQIRQERIRTAQIQQSAVNTGVGQSSGDIGGVSALTSQVGSNIGSMSGQIDSESSILNYRNQASSLMSQANTWGAIASLGFKGFNVFSETPQFKKDVANIFKE